MSVIREPIKVRAIDINDGSIDEYSSLAICGKVYNAGASLVMYWVRKGLVKHGKRFELIDKDIEYIYNETINKRYDTRNKKCIVEDTDGNVVAKYNSITDASRAYGIARCSMMYRIKAGIPYGGFVFKLDESEEPISFLPYKKDDILDREKYRILSYETKNRVCITPCPFFEFPKPMIGSGRCLKCTSFRGRSITTNEVACSRKNI